MAKTILITGAGRGIGRAVARSLKDNNLILLTKTQESLESLKEEFPNAKSFSVDITDEKQMFDFIEAVNRDNERLDVLINIAGLSYLAKPFEESTEEDFDLVYSMYMRAPFSFMKRLLPMLRKGKDPIVINLTSAAAFAKFRNESLYSAVKSAATVLTDVAREELQKDRIRFTTIQPYGVNTWNDPEPENVLRPEDIGDLASFIINMHPNCEILNVSLSSVNQWRSGKQPWIEE